MFAIGTTFAKKMKLSMNSGFNLPFRIYFFLGAVRIHIIELVLLLPDSVSVDMMRVLTYGSPDSHLVG